MSSFAKGLTATAVLAALVLAGCAQPRDPATEVALDPEPGLYRITLSGAGLAQYVQQGPTETRDEICVRSSDSRRFPDRLAQNYFSLHPGCNTRKRPREGNLIGGTVTCPLDPEKATGTATVEYEGVVSATGVEATSRMRFDMTPRPGTLSPEEQRQLKLGTAMAERVGILVKAVRTGDCP